MATEERLILNSTTDATGVGKAVTDFPQLNPNLSSSGRYDFPKQVWHVKLDEAALITVTFTLTRTRPRTSLEAIIDDLEGLERKRITSKRAIRSAKTYIFETYAKMGHDFPRPTFIPDGEGGIVIKWLNNGRVVRLSCRADRMQKTYIYYEAQDLYDIEPDSTVGTLRSRLYWLNGLAHA